MASRLRVKKFCFVAFTRNLICKSLKTHHFLNETSKIDFLGLKNTIFSQFRPRCPPDFMFTFQNLKPNLWKMQFLGLKSTIFSKFCPRYAQDFTFRPSLNKFLGPPMCQFLFFVFCFFFMIICNTSYEIIFWESPPPPALPSKWA